ncbi:MAG: 50S ribosomal protein L19 [Bacilli bacterium]|nr:50S ribosomal protein L19 [Bacilli bacterium]
MAKNLIEKITEKQLNPNIPEFRVGDTVVVGCKIKDFRNGKEVHRIQNFKGLVIARKNSGITETFTVRSTYSGIGVEKVFPIHSPNIDKIEVVKKGKVRRAKLYFLRGRNKKYNIKERANKESLKKAS